MKNTTAVLIGGFLACACGAVSSAQAVDDFGLSYSPLGQATVTVDSTGNLNVGNLGSSGQDGVSINLAGVQNPQADFSLDSFITPNAAGVTGSYFKSAVYGSYGGGTNQQISSLTATQTASGDTQINAAFAALSAQPVTINYYDNGTLVYSENGGTGGGVPSIIIRWPIQSSPFTGFVDYVDTPGAFPDSIGVDLQYLQTVVTAGGTVLPNVNLIDFSVAGNLGPAQYTSNEITAGGGGIDSFAITGAALTPEPSTLALAGIGAVSLVARRKRRAM